MEGGSKHALRRFPSECGGMIKLLTMREFLESASYLGTAQHLGGPSWLPWRVLLIALMGEALTLDELAIFQTLTGRLTAPSEPCREAWLVIGRRAGKTRAAACLAAFLATCIDYRDVLAPGELGELVLLAKSKDQAKRLFRFIKGIFSTVPRLTPFVEGMSNDELTLTSDVEIIVQAASYRSARGGTSIGVVCDELAYWYSDERSANPDSEIIGAVRPSLVMTKGPLICVSTPYARKGTLYETFTKHFGEKGSPKKLVALAPTLTMNSTLTEADLADDYETDPVKARCEFECAWRSDVETFVALEVVRACVDFGIFERPYDWRKSYFGFIDMALGGADSHALAVAHVEQGKTVLDVVYELRSYEHTQDYAVRCFVEVLREYHIKRVIADRVGLAWVSERFMALGTIKVDQSADPKSVLYGNFYAALNSGRVRLLDDRRLCAQLVSLERSTGSSGRDRIDHPPGGHDDVCNAVAGCLTMTAPKSMKCITGYYAY
jgi:hypothetical protein